MKRMAEASTGNDARPLPRGAKGAVVTPTYEGDFVLDEQLPLECGQTLANPTLHYAVYGRLNAARDNAVLVCHALTGSALVGSWWPEIFAPGSYAEKPASFAPFQEALSQASGIVVVTPEYNGGFPGVFKYFIDMLKFPETFTGKPFAFVGLSAGGGGAVRPVEQFSTLVTYLRGIIYPGTVNIAAIHNHLDESRRVKTQEMVERLEKQADGFIKFVAKR